MHVHSATIPEICVTPDLVEQRLACKDAFGGGRQRYQEVELLHRQIHALSIHFNASTGNIDAEIAKTSPIAILRLSTRHHLPLPLVSCSLAAAQNSFYPANQCARTKRLDQVVTGP